MKRARKRALTAHLKKPKHLRGPEGGDPEKSCPRKQPPASDGAFSGTSERVWYVGVCVSSYSCACLCISVSLSRYLCISMYLRTCICGFVYISVYPYVCVVSMCV